VSKDLRFLAKKRGISKEIEVERFAKELLDRECLGASGNVPRRANR
jgi:hypothetical protein